LSIDIMKHTIFFPIALLFLFALNQALRENNFQDFFIYRAGADMGLHGESPYDTAKLKVRILDQYPGEDGLANNAGFFQPPGGIVVFSPFAMLPYPVAKVAWAVVNALAAWAVLLLMRTFADPPGTADPTRPLAALVIAIAICLNFLTIALIVVGQTTLLLVGCVAAGQWCFEKGRPFVGGLLWSIAFVKPHIALPLIPLAWYLGGRRRGLGVITAVGLLTLVGCLLAGSSPLFLREYLDFLASSHKSVQFNKAECNTQITSWNRILIAAGGPVIELTAITTLAGYLVWYGFVAARCAITRQWPSPAWALAASAVGALVCCQVLGYEVFLLALVIPYLRDLFRDGQRVVPVLVLLLMGVQLVPFDFEHLKITAPRALAVAGVAGLVLWGPLRASSASRR